MTATRQTPQSEPIPGSNQVPNSAGGYAFAVDDWVRLDRFLILGSEGGSYYATEKKLTVENAEAVRRCIIADGQRVVARIVEISDAGRAPKNDSAVFALAMCAGLGDANTKRTAFDALPKVCRIGTHLFQFAESVQAFRGWGRGLRRAIAAWYSAKEPKALAHQLVKYQQRNGWSHRDLLRLSHPKVNEPASNALRWAVGKAETIPTAARPDDPLAAIVAFEQAKRATGDKEICRLIRDYNLPRECVPTHWLNEPAVWDALLEKMPLTAMLRSLGKMSAVGLLKPLSQAAATVAARLADQDYLRKSRIHPIAVLAAMLTYRAGCGVKGGLTWNAVPQILDALDGAFYLTFANVEPTGKRWLLALDVSGSMASGVVGGVYGLTPRVASAALALVTAAVEPRHAFVGFSHQLMPLTISPRQRLDDVCRYVDGLEFGRTDCALPMRYAQQEGLEVDTFVVLTDSETWHGQIHPCQALRQYRERTGIRAKLAVIGMVANGFSIADPADAGMMDFVGFDSSGPAVLADFARN